MRRNLCAGLTLWRGRVAIARPCLSRPARSQSALNLRGLRGLHVDGASWLRGCPVPRPLPCSRPALHRRVPRRPAGGALTCRAVHRLASAVSSRLSGGLSRAASTLRAIAAWVISVAGRCLRSFIAAVLRPVGRLALWLLAPFNKWYFKAVGLLCLVGMSVTAACNAMLPLANAHILPQVEVAVQQAVDRKVSIARVRWLMPTGLIGATPLMSVGPLSVGPASDEESTAEVPEALVRIAPLSSILRREVVIRCILMDPTVNLMQGPNFTWFGYPEDVVLPARGPAREEPPAMADRSARAADAPPGTSAAPVNTSGEGDAGHAEGTSQLERQSRMASMLLDEQRRQQWQPPPSWAGPDPPLDSAAAAPSSPAERREAGPGSFPGNLVETAKGLASAMIPKVELEHVQVQRGTLNARIVGERVPRCIQGVEGSIGLGKGYHSLELELTGKACKRDPANLKLTMDNPQATINLRAVTPGAERQTAAHGAEIWYSMFGDRLPLHPEQQQLRELHERLMRAAGSGTAGASGAPAGPAPESAPSALLAAPESSAGDRGTAMGPTAGGEEEAAESESATPAEDGGFVRVRLVARHIGSTERWPDMAVSIEAMPMLSPSSSSLSLCPKAAVWSVIPVAGVAG